MKIHEHQAAELLSQYQVPNAGGPAAFTPAEAAEAASSLGGDLFVVKAQIHAGGRGKAGGVKLAHSIAEVEKIAGELLGKTLVTKQTGPQGKVVHRLMVTRGVSIQKEFYLSFVMDGANEGVTLMASAEGGMEIEETAAHHPEKIARCLIDPVVGLRSFQIRRVAHTLGLTKEQEKEFAAMAGNLYRLFIDKDCSLIELNPLILTGEGHLMALDIKMDFDGNALFRHPELAELADPLEEDPKEAEAGKYRLNYIPLTGNIGCMVNGAGLAMATMDIIKAFGGEPANFLDVGGGASAEQVAGAFRILLSDPHVQGLFINIFGGIMRCDVLAEGIVEAARQVEVKVPMVVRLQGTNADIGKKLLNASGLDIHSTDDLAEAAHLIVSLSGGKRA